ncbi:MAG: dynamin family protein [Deltaproteobacteria bacterium]|nr:dynamin family protein [Deltaproteobacteria bacterium]
MGFLDRFERFLDDVVLLPDDLRADLEAADAAIDAGAHAEAEQLFLAVLSERPQLARAALGLAHARHGLGDREGTLAALKDARELIPEDGEVALWTARLALELGDGALAASASRAAARSFASEGGGRLADACATLAWAEWKNGRPDRAARELRKALAIRPTDELRLALVEALVDAGELAPARSAAHGLEPRGLGPDGALRAGRALARIGATEAAAQFLEAAAAGGRAEALLLLAEGAMSAGAPDRAETLAREAVAKGVGPQALVTLATVLAQGGRFAGAAEAFAAAAGATGDPELWRAALRAVPVTDVPSLNAFADALEKLAPGDPAARSARAWAALERAEPVPGLGADAESREYLAHVLASLDAGDPAAARALLERHDEVRAQRVTPWSADEALERQLRERTLRALWLDGGEVDLAAAIDAVARFAGDHRLDEVERRARQLRDELDRPLLLAVLGEFNAGKSTLINAFIGADVAPTGIVPTTATLNVLRSGAARRVRVVFADGHTREGEYEALGGMLEEAEAIGSDAEGAARVDRVEIVLPSEMLERTWILDAPGTNALDEEHERLAREAARRADAVLWIFDAAQAGKATESKMLDALRAEGRVIVPVLNKCDRLKEGELARVSGVVEASFGSAPIPLSAKRALKARLVEDEEALVASGFPAFLAALEERIFARSRTLKQGACAGRLSRSLEIALEREAANAEERATERARLLSRRKVLGEIGAELQLAVTDAVRAFDKEVDEAFDAAADEVLAFVRPRRSRFARQGADPEDRAFLADVLERRLRQAVDHCEARLAARLKGLLVEAVLQPDELGASIRAFVRPPLAAYWGFQRGLLEGGALQRFFDDVLPEVQLSRGPIAGALGKARANANEELRAPLLSAVADLQRALDDELGGAVQTHRQAEADRSWRLVAPLHALSDVLSEIARR